jgi:hypothetical protein
MESKETVSMEKHNGKTEPKLGRIATVLQRLKSQLEQITLASVRPREDGYEWTDYMAKMVDEPMNQWQRQYPEFRIRHNARCQGRRRERQLGGAKKVHKSRQGEESKNRIFVPCATS